MESGYVEIMSSNGAKQQSVDVFSTPMPQLHHFSYPDSDLEPEYAFQEAHVHAVSLLDMFFSDPYPEGDSSRQQQSRERISEYFYLPIAEAAKELKMGVTRLKKRCRDLGIRRWPRRKLISLQTLINNVQEMEKDEGEEKIMREDIESLEQEKKLIEERPDMELGDRTKRLRQACFKANFKKRKLMDDEFMSFLSDSSFTSDSNF